MGKGGTIEIGMGTLAFGGPFRGYYPDWWMPIIRRPGLVKTVVAETPGFPMRLRLADHPPIVVWVVGE